jgi:hypothetical protein
MYRRNYVDLTQAIHAWLSSRGLSVAGVITMNTWPWTFKASDGRTYYMFNGWKKLYGTLKKRMRLSIDSYNKELLAKHIGFDVDEVQEFLTNFSNDREYVCEVLNGLLSDDRMQAFIDDQIRYGGLPILFDCDMCDCFDYTADDGMLYNLHFMRVE